MRSRNGTRNDEHDDTTAQATIHTRHKWQTNGEGINMGSYVTIDGGWSGGRWFMCDGQRVINMVGDLRTNYGGWFTY